MYRKITGLNYENIRAQPIPLSEQGLQTVYAEPWLQVSEGICQLEGLCFDRNGDLYFLNVFGSTIYKLELPEKKLIEICTLEGNESPAALKIHKDGRLFIVCLGDFKSTGSVIAMSPDGSNLETIVPKSAGYVIDDMVFDKNGGFYFTDFKGFSCEPTGGVYYVSPDYKSITRVMGNMAVTNGIALNPQGNALWVTEMSNNRLHYIQLEEDGVTISDFGTSVPYHFTGYMGPDSCSIDSDGNLYVAMYDTNPQ